MVMFAVPVSLGMLVAAAMVGAVKAGLSAEADVLRGGVLGQRG
jgi:hypothetical protein